MMRIERTLRGVAALAGIILVLTLISLTVRALSLWWGLLLMLGVAILAIGTATLVRRRVPAGTVLEIDLDGGLIETTGFDPISRIRSRNAVTVRDVVDALERGAHDPRVSALVMRLGNGGVELGHAQELRDAVHRFRQNGKKTVAFAEAFGESGTATVDYYLAAAFEQIHLQPLGQVSIEGLVARSPFLRGALDKLRVVADFDHRKEYKAAKYLFTETGFTDPHREAVDAVARDQFSQIVEGISADRGLSLAEVERLIDTAPLTPDDALTAGLVDQIGFRDQAYETAGERSKFLFHGRYLKKAGRPHRKGQRIALVYGTGSIARGNSRFDPLTGTSSLGADDVAQALREAVDDDKVKAIVFRVDSPGGSAVASEVVGHEVARCRSEGKPVVVSMGNVAGSGGYWISAGANKIVAQPGTITGSIGVVAGKLANREAWRRLGITFDQIPFGQNASYGVAQDILSDTERERRTVIIDDIYDQFVQRVATGRNLRPEQVEEIARGRIWTGAQARDNGLVDVLGGLNTAIALAKEAAGIPADQDVRLTVLPRERNLPIPEAKEGSDPIHRVGAAVFEAMAGLGAAASAIQARMPWVTIR